jgi:alpha-tubulin suppressor-like RCC1 family protein
MKLFHVSICLLLITSACEKKEDNEIYPTIINEEPEECVYLDEYGNQNFAADEEMVTKFAYTKSLSSNCEYAKTEVSGTCSSGQVYWDENEYFESCDELSLYGDIFAGDYHTCILKTTGEIYCWGSSVDEGVRGTNEETDYLHISKVTNPQGVLFTTASTGGSTVCAIGDDDKTYCWGDNTNGQLGNGDTENRQLPTEVDLPEGIIFSKIDVGQNHVCALTDDGIAYCWGNGSFGQLGNSLTDSKYVPTPVSMPEGISFSEITLGNYHTCATTTSSTIYCWGDNISGQLGNGTNSSSSTPVEVTMPENVYGLSRLGSGSDFNCAVGENNKFYCWGNGEYGQLGDGQGQSRNTPGILYVDIGGTLDIGVYPTMFALGYRHSCAVGNNNKVYCWGWGAEGQIGRKMQSNVASPIIIEKQDHSTSSLASGMGHTCMVNSGSVYCWGKNDSCQYGGSCESQGLPTLLTL